MAVGFLKLIWAAWMSEWGVGVVIEIEFSSPIDLSGVLFPYDIYLHDVASCHNYLSYTL